MMSHLQNRPHQFSWAVHFSRLVCMLSAVCSAGCSGESGVIEQALAKAQATVAKQRTEFTSLETGDPSSEESDGDFAGQPAHDAQTEVPFPNRVNPFEFAEGVDFDMPSATSSSDTFEIKLYGFIGDQNPKAIVNLGGTTKMLATGEAWGGIEVVEVTPPTVRIKANGVMRVWSLLGHHEQSGL